MVGIEISDLMRLTESAVNADRLLREDLVNFAKKVLMERANEEAKGENDSMEITTVKLGIDAAFTLASNLTLLDPKNPVLRGVSREAIGVMNERAGKDQEMRKRAEERSREIDVLNTEEIFRLLEKLKNDRVKYVLDMNWTEREPKDTFKPSG